MVDNPLPPERLLGDYGGANASTDRLTIVNQPVNMANFQLNPMEEIKFLKQNNSYSNTYNLGWKNNPNFSWKDQKGTTPQHGQYQTQYQQLQQQQAPKKADWEIAIERMAAHNVQFQEETCNNQKNSTSSIKNLEVQMGQITQQLASSSQAQGALPSATVTNPREPNNIKENEVVGEEVVAQKPVVKGTAIEPKSVVKLPFPPRNKKKGQYKKNFEKFLELFKKLEINIPLLEALEQIPNYAKFMKDIISKRRTADTNSIILTETCSAILQGMKIPIKKKYRGVVTIPCTIGDRSFNKALIDLGASVSLIPLSIYNNLGIGYMQDTRMTLKFADHSVKKPYEMPEDEEIPFILGRPFLESGRCLINIEEGTMTLKVYDEELKIDVRNTMRYKDDICTSHTIEVMDQVMMYDSPLNAPQSPLERVLSLSIFDSDKEVHNGESEVLALLDV
ncbi:uncharacterized protein LOC127079991 [Lathyrus oleraceus]|uniref:uncharacterized protein LOC127079991 n=1 Tax=Pisum sativum TaxID=3888 RepID=UPI0021CEA12D|nr:uncharacterized protein LOC127079991 [Pisum sativum]